MPRIFARLDRAWIAIAIWTLLVLFAGGGSTYWWFEKANATPAGWETAALLAAGLLIVSCFTFFNLLLRWIRWHFLLRRLGVAVPAKSSAHVYGLLLPAVLTPFSLGELFAAAFLAPYTKRPGAVALGVWVISRMADACVLAAFLGWVALIGSLVPACLIALALTTITVQRGQSLFAKCREYALLVAAFAAVSLAAWAVPVLAMYAAGAVLHIDISLSGGASAFAQGTLVGGSTGLPGGIVTAGEVMIEALADSGLKLAEAVQIVAVTRFGTVGFAAALGLLLWVVGWRYARAAVMASDARTQAHFDDLAGEYIDEIPDHIRDRLVARKIDGMCRSLAAHGFGEGARGLDLGCGQGWYALALSQRGFQMTGCDPSIGQVCAAQEFAAAQNAELDIFHAGGESLPFADASFDFVYCINVMHHVTGRSAKTRVLSEIRRVLKPGGVFFMHEMNVRNPLFRLYMSYLFPLIKRIDDGTEVWIPPHQLPPVPGASWSPDVWYFTFLPDFLPRQVMRLLEPIEKRLEQSVMCVWSAHYMARLVKESS